jgi:hypothetical protein
MLPQSIFNIGGRQVSWNDATEGREARDVSTTKSRPDTIAGKRARRQELIDIIDEALAMVSENHGGGVSILNSLSNH